MVDMMSKINEQVKRSKATWYDETTKIFCEVCAEEVHAGNRPHTHFSKIGWNNVVIKFQQRSGKMYDQKQLKNKWEKLKTEYTTWKNLIEKETGLGWDHEKNTIVASDQWWALKEQASSGVAKFREAGIQNLTELEIMFAKIIVSATTLWNPYSQDDTEIEDSSTIGNEKIEDEEQVDITMDGSINETVSQQLESESIDKTKVNTTSEQRGKKTQKGKKSKVSTAKLMPNELKRIVGAMENFSQSSSTVTSKRTDLPGCSIGECLTLLATTPGISSNGSAYDDVMDESSEEEEDGEELVLQEQLRGFHYVLDGNGCKRFYLHQPGSVHDNRILKDAMEDPKKYFPHPPEGKYYVIDAGYPNMKGFLAPFKDPYYIPYYIPEVEGGVDIGGNPVTTLKEHDGSMDDFSMESIRYNIATPLMSR
uniref:Myb/SANT-like domain-containing protein n=1 Tax=Chenopodium quinoa TaxID=63459 RepID=A0A803MR63_CHEQI